MKFIKRFVNACVKPQKLNTVPQIPFSKVLFYFFFLVFISAIPVIFSYFSTLNQTYREARQIVDKLPKFDFQEGKLHLLEPAEGFIYQTDNLIFTFDPAGKRSESAIEKDTLHHTISLALLKDRFIFSLPSEFTAAAQLTHNVYTFPYNTSYFEDLNSEIIRKTFYSSISLQLSKGIIVVMTFYFALMELLINLLIVTICASLYSKLKLVGLTWLQNFKLVTYAATLPLLIITFLTALNVGFPPEGTSPLVILLTLFVYSRILRSNWIPHPKP